MEPKFKTYQEAFDSTVEHLAAQKSRAYNGGCVYLCLQTQKQCAVGFHLPKDHPALKHSGGYTSLIEDYPDIGELLAIPEVIDIIPEGEEFFDHPGMSLVVRRNSNQQAMTNAAFWRSLQSAHDISGDIETLKNRLFWLAKLFRLSYENVNKITEWNRH